MTNSLKYVITIQKVLTGEKKLDSKMKFDGNTFIVLCQSSKNQLHKSRMGGHFNSSLHRPYGLAEYESNTIKGGDVKE